MSRDGVNRGGPAGNLPPPARTSTPRHGTRMWEFVWKHASELEAVVLLAIFVTVIWMAPPKPGPRKEDQWPFGADPKDRNHQGPE